MNGDKFVVGFGCSTWNSCVEQHMPKAIHIHRPESGAVGYDIVGYYDTSIVELEEQLVYDRANRVPMCFPSVDILQRLNRNLVRSTRRMVHLDATIKKETWLNVNTGIAAHGSNYRN